MEKSTCLKCLKSNSVCFNGIVNHSGIFKKKYECVLCGEEWEEDVSAEEREAWK